MPADLLERVRALDRKLPGLDEAAYGLESRERFGDAIARSWNKLVGAWATLQDGLANLPSSDAATTTTRERFLLPLFEELGYGRLSPTKAIEIDGKAYPVSHGYETVPLHLVGANIAIDHRTKGVAGAAGQSPHGLVQELLNRSPDRLWGIVTNGRTLRILRDNASLVRQAYVEFDLEAIMAGEGYADFALLWHLAHRTRLQPRVADGAEDGAATTQAGSYLERWSKVAEETGARARDRLRDGVQEAIEALGSGFLAHPANAALKTALDNGELTTQDYYRELLRLVYRFILLFVAEDRDLLLDPKAEPAIKDRYARYYSTARLRRLAERRRGSRHADLYAGLKVVMTALGSDDGAPGIGLPPLGGFLFGPEACLHLDAAELANGDLLEAIRKLATIEEKSILRTVDYRNLGSEELGSIYESLLELHPEIDTAAAAFRLTTAAGHERKTTGSYYTPSSLISVLLDSALDPVLAEIADKPTKEEAERAILEMSVVDPAAGSGHFLVAAAHRIAKRLAQVRTEDEEPAPAAITTALRDVIGHCLYAVDINPMAVELCKVSLWLEALEPGKPLTFLDAHIKCGNSLLGTTPELIAKGIPDAAYDPIEGDDKAVAAALKKRNRLERDQGQLSLGEAGLDSALEALVSASIELEQGPDDLLGTVRRKERLHGAIRRSPSYTDSKLIADSWVAAFTIPKTEDHPAITTETLRRVGSPRAVSGLEATVRSLAVERSLLHWFIEFPHVVSVGGFDVVLGNPPWERVKLQDKEFFAERDPSVAGARNAAHRKRMIADLLTRNPVLLDEYRHALRQVEAEGKLLRSGGQFPLTGRGDLNTYSVFAELMRSLVGPRGRAGAIVPSGIATDDTTKYFFESLVSGGNLVSLHSFENEEFVFPAVHHAFRFCLVTMGGGRIDGPADFVFFARQVASLGDHQRHFSLTPDEFLLLNPNSRTCPIFRSGRDAEVAKRVYQVVPILRRLEPESDPWRISFLRMFDMASDSALFHGTTAPSRVPLYEAKLIHQYTHRWATYEDDEVRDVKVDELRDPAFAITPRYWVERSEVEERIADRWTHDWFLAFRDITGVEKVRTAIAAAIPRTAVGHHAPIILSEDPRLPLMIANLNAFAFDWQARQKVGGVHLTFGIFEQLPVLGPHRYDESVSWATTSLAEWLRPLVVELVYTSTELQGFARDLGWNGGPFKWDERRRSVLRAEIDAGFFHLYGLPRADVEHVMDSFWIVRDRDEKEHGAYRTKKLVLDAYDALASPARNSRPVARRADPEGPIDPPPDGAAHGAGLWTPWEDVLARPRHVPLASARSPRDLQRSQTSETPYNPVTVNTQKRAPIGSPRTFDPIAGQAQQTLGELLDTSRDPGGWLPESLMDPATILSGSGVRHRSFGEGEVLSVNTAGRRTTVRIRFGAEEREISFGYGLLEFHIVSTR